MPQLIIGNLNYSSWSIRALLVARGADLEITEDLVPLGRAESRPTLQAKTGYRQVPVLVDEDLVIPDSLAITEWIAERVAPGQVWPEDSTLRAKARAAVAQMHAGFTALRTEMPVDICRQHPTPALSRNGKTDIAQILSLWAKWRDEAPKGDFLFGKWCAADAFYAPVVTRFRTYGIALEGDARAYSDAVMTYPLMQTLIAEAKGEPWVLGHGPDGPIQLGMKDAPV